MANETNTGPHGIPMDVATDPVNESKFTTDLPTVDFAARTLAADQKTYFDRWDTNKDAPMNRAGLHFKVHLKDD